MSQEPMAERIAVQPLHEITQVSENAELIATRLEMRTRFVTAIDTPELVDGQPVSKKAGYVQFNRGHFDYLLKAKEICSWNSENYLASGREPLADIDSDDILTRAAAVMSGATLSESERGGFGVRLVRFTLSELRENPPKVFQEKGVAQKIMSTMGLYNWRLMMAVPEDNFAQSNGNLKKIINDADVQIRSSTGYGSSLEAVGSMPFLTLKRLKEEGVNSVWIGLDPPGQNISQFATNYEQLQSDFPYLTSLTNYSMVWQFLSEFYGINVKGQGLVETGHSRGAARLLFDGKDKWQDPRIAHILIAPVFKHKGVEGQLARVLLGAGSGVASRVNNITWIKGLTNELGRKFIQHYVGTDDPKLVDLYTHVYREMIGANYGKMVMSQYINDLLRTEAPMMRTDTGQIDMVDGRDYVFNFTGDRFVNLPEMWKEQRRKFGESNMKVVQNLPGGHHAWNADGSDPTGILHENREKIVEAHVSAAKKVSR